MSSIAPRHVRAALAVAAAGCLALTGCSGTPGANGSPTSAGSSSASQSGSPSQSASASASTPATPEPATSTSPAKNIAKPKMPSEAKEFSKDGYAAFLQYWIDVQNYAIATGDTAPLAEASHDKCGVCVERSKLAKYISKRGSWQVGGQLKAASFFTKLEKLPAGYYQSVFQLTQEAGTYYQADGTSDPQLKAVGLSKTSQNAFAFHDKTKGWQMAAIERVDANS